MNIQQEIDALSASGGGKVMLPPGDYRGQGSICIPSGVHLIGSGVASCIIENVTARSTNPNDTRRYWLGLQDVYVYGDGSGGAKANIGVDFREVSNGFVNRVQIQGFKTGLLLAGIGCYYNEITSVFTDCSVDGIELYNGANQNTIVNCKPSAPIAIQIINTNGTTIIGGSGEGATPSNFIKQSGGSAGTAVRGFRGESPGYGPVWCNTDNLVGSF